MIRSRGLIAATVVFGLIAPCHATLCFLPNRTGQNIMKFDAETGEYKGSIGTGFVGTLVTSATMNPYDGYLYVNTSSRIQRFDPYTGEYAGSLADGFMSFGDGIAFIDATTMVVGDIRSTGNAVLKFNPTTGEYKGIIALGFLGNSGAGVSVAYDGSTLFVTGANGTGVQKFNPITGDYLGVYGSGFFSGARGLTITDDSKVLVGSLSAGSIMRFATADGAFGGLFANGFIPNGRGMAKLPNGQIIARTLGSSTEYVCRFVPETGEYKGLFAANWNIGGFDVSVETPAQVCGTVSLQDWTLQADQPCVVEIIDGGGNTVQSTPIVPDVSGNWCITTFFRGDFSVGVKPWHWLRKVVSNVTIGRAGATGVNTDHINGDVDDDNEVGPGDFAILSGAFGNVLGDAGYIPAADLDGDEEIGPSDFSILSGNFGESGD